MSAMRKTYRQVLIDLERYLKLPKDTLTCLDSPAAQHRLKLVKYFPVEDDQTSNQAQGVGAHQDETGWLTFVSEIDEPGLQVHLRNGREWIEIPIGIDCWGLNIG